MNDPNYVNMSLDEVIRDMRQKRAFGEKPMDNSPFLRKRRFPLSYSRPPRNQFKGYKPNFYGRNNNSNFMARNNNPNYMAKKIVRNALKTMDLRYKLNRLRATTEGLDLRWKIVANEIARLRNAQRGSQAGVQASTRYHPYGGHPLTEGVVPDANILGGEIVPRRSRVSLNHLQRRVGMKLPEWIYGPLMGSPPTIVHQPHHHYHHHHGQSPPIMCGSSSAPVCCQQGSNGFVNQSMPSLVEAPPPPNHSGIRGITALSHQHSTDGMPQLAYQAPLPGRRAAPPSATMINEMNRMQGAEDQIEYLVVEDGMEVQQQQPAQHTTKLSLHERFSSQY